MKRKKSRGRPMKSDEIIVKAVPRDEVDVNKMALALIGIANDVAKKKTALSCQKSE